MGLDWPSEYLPSMTATGARPRLASSSPDSRAAPNSGHAMWMDAGPVNLEKSTFQPVSVHGQSPSTST